MSDDCANGRCVSEQRIFMLETMQNKTSCDVAKTRDLCEKIYSKMYVSNGELCFNEKIRNIDNTLKVLEDIEEIKQWVTQHMEAEQSNKKKMFDAVWRIVDYVVRFIVVLILGYLAVKWELKG